MPQSARGGLSQHHSAVDVLEQITLCLGGLSCALGAQAASPGPAHQMPEAPSLAKSHDVQKSLPRGVGEDRELLLKGYSVSVWGEENLSETDSGDDRTMW